MTKKIQIKFDDSSIKHVDSMREVYTYNLNSIEKVSFQLNNERFILDFNGKEFYYDYQHNNVMNLWYVDKGKIFHK